MQFYRVSHFTEKNQTYRDGIFFFLCDVASKRAEGWFVSSPAARFDKPDSKQSMIKHPYISYEEKRAGRGLIFQFLWEKFAIKQEFLDEQLLKAII